MQVCRIQINVLVECSSANMDKYVMENVLCHVVEILHKPVVAGGEIRYIIQVSFYQLSQKTHRKGWQHADCYARYGLRHMKRSLMS